MAPAEAVDYMVDHLPIERASAEAEVRRYCAWPTQASSYLTGCLEILRIRQRFLESRGLGGVPAAEIRDPTGCGDAYRAGLLFGLMNGLDWQTTGNIASLMGSIKIAHNGTQNHSFTSAEFRERFRNTFAYDYLE
jgi:hypothetical protein